MTTILEDIVAEGERVLGLASQAGVPMRLLGGVAIRLHADELPPSLDRRYKDLDFAVTKKGASAASTSTTPTAARLTCSCTRSGCATRSRSATASRSTQAGPCRWPSCC